VHSVNIPVSIRLAWWAVGWVSFLLVLERLGVPISRRVVHFIVEHAIKIKIEEKGEEHEHRKLGKGYPQRA
jgi:hypothetical protein